MRKGYFLIAVVLGIGASTLGQATAPESQSLQALLAEVRGLRQDLHDTLGRVHSSQILLARLQLQQAAVTRASLHLDDARSKLAEVQVAIGGESAQIKALEETLPNAQQTQAMIEETLKQARADLETSRTVEQQRQAVEAEADRQFRAEQDKLTSLESQLDDLVQSLNEASQKAGANPH